MKDEDLRKYFRPFLLPNANYVQAADFLDCPENNPPQDQYVPACFDIYYMQEPNTEEDIRNVMEKETISLIEGAHLLAGIKLNDISAVILSKTILHIYKAAINSIKNKHLKVDSLNELGYWEDNFCDNVISFHSQDQKICIRIQGNKHGIVHHFKLHILIDWALSQGLLVDEKLLQFIGVLPVAECLDHMKSEASYLPSHFLLFAAPLLLSKNEIKDMSMLAAAQVLWYIIPDQTIEKMPENPLIKKYIPNNEYSNRHIFRNKVKIIDPRKKKTRPSKSAINIKKSPDIPIIIPGVIIQKEDGRYICDFLKLKIICKTLVSTLLKINPALQEDQLVDHELIQLYIGHLHPIIAAMAKEWALEAKRESFKRA